MNERESKVYGMSVEDIHEEYMNGFTAKFSGLEMVVAGILSDVQEQIMFKNPTIPSPNVDERIRKQLNVAKYILSEMMKAKREAEAV